MFLLECSIQCVLHGKFVAVRRSGPEDSCKISYDCSSQQVMPISSQRGEPSLGEGAVSPMTTRRCSHCSRLKPAFKTTEQKPSEGCFKSQLVCHSLYVLACTRELLPMLLPCCMAAADAWSRDDKVSMSLTVAPLPHPPSHSLPGHPPAAQESVQ